MGRLKGEGQRSTQQHKRQGGLRSGACGCHPWMRPLSPPGGLAGSAPVLAKQWSTSGRPGGQGGKHPADSKLSLGSGCLQTTGVAHKGPHCWGNHPRGACPAWPLVPEGGGRQITIEWSPSRRRVRGDQLHLMGGPSLFGPTAAFCVFFEQDTWDCDSQDQNSVR